MESKDKYGETPLWWAVEGWHDIREIYSLNARVVRLIDTRYKPVIQLLLAEDDADIDINTIYT